MDLENFEDGQVVPAPYLVAYEVEQIRLKRLTAFLGHGREAVAQFLGHVADLESDHMDSVARMHAHVHAWAGGDARPGAQPSRATSATTGWAGSLSSTATPRL